MKRRYNHGYLETVEQTIYHGGDVEVVSIFVCNTSGSNTTYSLFHVPKDEDSSNEYALFFENVVRSKETEVIEVPIHVSPGERLTAKAGASNAVILTMYLDRPA